MTSGRPTKTSIPGVYRRGDRYKVTYRDRQGKQRSKSARTLEEARNLKVGFEAAKRTPGLPLTSQITFEQHARDWLKSYTGRRTRIRERTRRDYLRQLERHVFPAIGSLKLVEISPGDIDDLIAGLLTGEGATGQALRPATVSRTLVPVRSAFRRAIRQRLIATNPALDPEIPGSMAPENSSVRVLTRDELHRLISMVPDEHRLFVTLLGCTGLRWSEAVALGPEHVDGVQPVLRVRRSGAGGVLDAPKTREARRDIRLDPSLWMSLKQKAQEAEGHQFLFHQRDGRMLAYPHMRKYVLKAAAERAGIVGVKGFHTLRHTAGSQLYADGWSELQIQHFLGHSSSDFTRRTYVHLMNDGAEPILAAPSSVHADQSISTGSQEKEHDHRTRSGVSFGARIRRSPQIRTGR